MQGLDGGAVDELLVGLSQRQGSKKEGKPTDINVRWLFLILVPRSIITNDIIFLSTKNHFHTNRLVWILSTVNM